MWAGFGRRCAVVVAVVTVGIGTVATTSGASAPAVKRGAACLPGHWKLDLQRLVSEASVTQKLTPSGAVDLVFRRGTFLQTYSDILTGETTGANGTTVKVEQKYAGAVSGKYTTTGSARNGSGALDLADISNATEMVMTTTVNGIAGAPNRQVPAPGTETSAVTLAFTCRGNTLQITAGGPVAQHYDRLR